MARIPDQTVEVLTESGEVLTTLRLRFVTETAHIGPLDLPTRTQHAELNASQVIASTALPEAVIHALVGLVDAVSAAFRAVDDAEREAPESGHAHLWQPRDETLARLHGRSAA